MNWSVYNDSLVRRGGILLDFTVLWGGDCEIKRMNAGRRQFIYPNSLLGFYSICRIGGLRASLGHCQGMLRVGCSRLHHAEWKG